MLKQAWHYVRLNRKFQQCSSELGIVFAAPESSPCGRGSVRIRGVITSTVRDRRSYAGVATGDRATIGLFSVCSPIGHRLGAWQARPRHPARARRPKTGERNTSISGPTKPNRHTKKVAVVPKNIQPRPLSRFFLLRYRIKIIRRSQISD